MTGGGGTFITYPDASRELSIAVPHPLDDSTTQDQGIGVFKGTGSRSFLLAGSRRTLGGPSACQATLGFEASDAEPHNVAHPFFAATQALAAWYGSGEWTQVQFHGMSQQTCGSEVHLTNGITTPPAPTSLLSVLKQNVRKHHPQWLVTVPGDTLPDGGAACSLNGTTDTEGRFLNGVPVAGCCSTPASSASGRFIHIEQDPNMRLASDWIQPVLDTWPPTVRLTAPADGATLAGPRWPRRRAETAASRRRPVPGRWGAAGRRRHGGPVRGHARHDAACRTGGMRSRPGPGRRPAGRPPARR